MHVKFIARGAGSRRPRPTICSASATPPGSSATASRSAAAIPTPVAAVADSLAFKHKYTSGVIAGAGGPADRRADRGRARQVRADRLGRARARPLRLVGGRAPRAGRRCARAHLRRPLRPRDGQEPQHRAARLAGDVRPLRDAFNHEHGWSRPDDPARCQANQPGHRALIDAANLRAGLEVEADPREVIRDYLLQRVEHASCSSRADVVAGARGGGASTCRARARTTSPPATRRPGSGGG